MTVRTRTYLRGLMLAARLAAVGAISAGAMMLTAPAGNAIPESTIQSECDSAGGTYTQVIVDGKSYSRCCYRGIDGVKLCDHYVDGTYTNTYNILEQPQTPPPPPPSGEVVGPPATAATRPPPSPAPGVVGPPATAATQAPPPDGMILWPGYTQIPPAP
jgi:hypothetical protein